VKIGHICLSSASNPAAAKFMSVLESLDLLTIRQHVVVADESMARRLHSFPSVSVSPSTKSPVVAYCLMPEVDIVHIHEPDSGQAGLLLTLTRSIPFVMTVQGPGDGRPGALQRLVMNRARALLPADRLNADYLIDVYRRYMNTGSELPQNSDCG